MRDDTPRAYGINDEACLRMIVHPVQFQDLWHGTGHSPERELATAVLAAAAEDLIKYRYALKRRRQRLYWEAYAWVNSDDREWPFTFVNLCEVLGIEPAGMRRVLLGGNLRLQGAFKLVTEAVRQVSLRAPAHEAAA